jgi:hypothetical protein
MPVPSFETSRAKRAVRCFFASFLAVLLTGCNTTCFVGVFNPPNSGILVTNGNPPSACTQNQITASFRLVAHMAPACTNCTATLQLSRMTLLLSGAALHPGVIADENSPDWQEVSGDLAAVPQRTDLVADPVTHQFLLPLTVTGHLPAGQYYQLRLRLAESSSLETADGRVHTLAIKGQQSFLYVQFAPPFIVVPSHANELRIALHPDWNLIKTSSESIESAPQLRGEVAGNTSTIAPE